MQQIDVLHPSQDVFDCKFPIPLLSFLEVLRDTLFTLGSSEASSVRVFANFIYAKAKDLHTEQFSFVQFYFDGYSPEGFDIGTRTYVYHAMKNRILPYEIFQLLYDYVTN